MAIRIEQPGASAAAAKAGVAIGKGQKAEKEQAQAEQARQQQVAIKAQEKARQAAMDWELQKMQMRSQQEFQQELAAKQWDYEKFNRAKAWEINKMELTSQMDFEREEKERIKDIEHAQNIVNALEKETVEGRESEKDPLFQVRVLKAQLELDAAIGGYRSSAVPTLPKESLLGSLSKGVQDVDAGESMRPEQVTLKMAEEAAVNKQVYVKDTETGKVVQVPLDEVKSLVDKKEAEIINPTVEEIEGLGNRLDATQKEFEDIGSFLERFFLPKRGPSPATRSALDPATQRLGFHF